MQPSMNGAERGHRAPGDLGERRPLVAEDPRIAVLIGGDRPLEQPCEQGHRMLRPGVLRIRLDPVEVAFLLGALDLEARDERGQLVADDDHDRPLVREEVETDVVLDVRLVEEHDRRAGVLEQPRAARREFLGAIPVGCTPRVYQTIRSADPAEAFAVGVSMPARIAATLGRLPFRANSGDHSGMAQVEIDLEPGAAGGLLERGAELARLSGYVEAIAKGGAGRVVLLGGEAGVGKSALVETLRAAHPELTTLRGGCEPLFAPPPLGPLLGLAEGGAGSRTARSRTRSRPRSSQSSRPRRLCSCSRTCTGPTRRRWTCS